MASYSYKGRSPMVSPTAMVFDNATIIGDVTLDHGVGVWPGASIRADNDRIVIREQTNIQELAVLHVDAGVPMEIGPYVTVGHKAVLHGCRIGEGSLIGIGAVVLNNATVGKHCLIGAGALVPEGREIPDRSLVVGVGKVVRSLTDDEVMGLRAGADGYAEKARSMDDDLIRLD